MYQSSKYRIYKEHGELQQALERLQYFTEARGPTWTEIADQVSYTIAKALMSEDVDVEERYQQSLALGEALKARRGKAVPVRIREIVGTLEGVTTALRALRRLALGLNVMDMDDSMGKIIMLRMRWGRLLEFVDEESDWITRLVTEARWKVAEGVDQGKLSSRFKTLMNRAAVNFGIEIEAPVDENCPPKIRRLSEGEGVRVKWDSDDDL